MKNNFITLVLLLLALPYLGSSQDSLTYDLGYEVSRVYPSISITEGKLKEADTLININPRYPSSWIREYISVEILTSHKGKIKKAVSKNDILSQEQKNNMNMADIGTDILVKVQYIPENTLKQNDPKELTFTFTVDPENDAKFPGGAKKLDQYLKENAIDKIPTGSIEQYNLTAVKFTVTEEGQIVDAHIFDTHIFNTSKNEKIDKLLVETICNMPDWKPAEYSNGIKVKQEFVLAVGDMKSCTINLLNIRRLSSDE